MSKAIQSLIKNEYDLKQLNSQNKLDFKKEATYINIPRLKEIENEIQLCGVKYNKAILLGITSINEALNELNLKLVELKREKNCLLINANLPTDYLDPEYECIKCKDTGFIHEQEINEKCSCYKQKLINYIYSVSNIKLTDSENFSSFDENLYLDEKNEGRYGINISPKQNI